MSDWKEYVLPGAAAAVFLYFLTIIIFDFFLRGFAPFIPSRPWVVKQIMDELVLKKPNAKMVAFSSGRSGFFRALEKKYPQADLTGIEPQLFPYLVSKFQQLVGRTRIKIEYQKIRRTKVKDADLIYCHLDPGELRELSSKFKFECKPGTIIISTGFNIPYLNPVKIVPLEDRKGRLDFLSKNQALFQSKYKKFKKEKKAYFYEI